MRNGNIQFRVFILLCIILSIAFNLTNAFGATINVPTIDYPTIQAGIDAAVNGDTVLVAEGTYTGAGNKNLDFKGKAITVISENGPNNTIIDCEGDGRGFYFHTGEGENSVLSGFTITKGQADFGGGIACFNSSPTITNCIVTDNAANGMGGGIYCETSSPIINNSIISKNSASQYGGGIAGQNGSSPNITDSNIIENRAFMQGMGVYSRESSMSFLRCTIQDNYSMSTAGDGGGIYCYDSNTVVDGCVISGHRVGSGGGIHCSGGSLEITDSTISDNEGTNIPNYGGGIHCSGVDVNITGCTISQNTAGGGGGIYSYNSTLNISRCIITENRSTQFRSDGYGGGGGLFCPNSTGSITSCLITKNSAANGGGISTDGNAPNITNCTISQNSASGDRSGSNPPSGAIYIRNSSPVITNCIFWENSPGEIFVDGGSPAVTYSTVQNGWSGEGNISDNPEFVDPINGDYHLADYSPCIGTGTSDGAPASDIEGNPRPNPSGSNPDMGAYENSRDTRDIPPLDIFGLYLGNVWQYQGTYAGGSYTSGAEVISIDQTTFPATTHIIEHKVNGSIVGRNWYETTSSELKLWGEDFGEFYGFSSGLVVAWYPMQVGDHRMSSATLPSQGLIFNVSMAVDVLIKESIDLGFDTFEAYKVRYILRVWGHGMDMSDTFYRWVVPYLGFVKVQDSDQTEVLTDFAIGSGIITPESDDDGDGLKDYQELIIYNTNWRDTDTDDDGLTDSDEVNTYGTDPNNKDTDGDGLTDKEEVDGGRNPTNREPETPVLAQPLDGATGVDLAPTLETDSFSDTDFHNHDASEWQISTQQNDFSDDMLVFKAESELALTALTVPSYILDENTTYYWSARFHDDGDAASEWAVPFEFTTGASGITDNNSNGIPDSQDLGPDESELDLNDDGIFDDQQQSATWKCLNTVIGDSHVGIEGKTNVVSIDFVESIDPGTIADTVNRPDSLPAGLISFSLTVPNDGDSADVTIYLYGSLANMQWYKCNEISGWQPYPASFGTTGSGNTYVELTLTDGGAGDADGLANGVIVDPSGAGAVAGGGGGGGGSGGGCLISTAAYASRMPKESLALLLLFGCLMISLSKLRRKLKK